MVGAGVGEGVELGDGVVERVRGRLEEVELENGVVKAVVVGAGVVEEVELGAGVVEGVRGKLIRSCV